MKRPFSKFASLPRPKRRALLLGSLAAAGISCLVGLILITFLEVGVGKSLSCWVWDDCSTAEASSSDVGVDISTQKSTLPTILGGGQSASSTTIPEEAVGNPPNPQQQTGSSAGTPQGAPSQAAPPAISGATQTPDGSPGAQPGQRQAPSDPVEEGQQQNPSSKSVPADQQPSSADNSEGSESAEGQ
jgi:hypothetical protein